MVLQAKAFSAPVSKYSGGDGRVSVLQLPHVYNDKIRKRNLRSNVVQPTASAGASMKLCGQRWLYQAKESVTYAIRSLLGRVDSDGTHTLDLASTVGKKGCKSDSLPQPSPYFTGL